MGVNCSLNKRKSQQLDQTIKILQRIKSIDDFNKEILQLKPIPLYRSLNHIQLHQQTQEIDIKHILSILDVLICHYYIPSQYMINNGKLLLLEKPITRAILECHIIIQDIKLSKQVWWDENYFSHQYKSVRDQFQVEHIKEKSQESPLINNLLFLSECFKQQFPQLSDDRNMTRSPIYTNTK
ncbi:hypothetical protein pb186bvf_015481 [Paramecium bursaria]